MKLVIILSIVEHQEEIAALFHRVGIKRFSSMSIAGYKRNKDDTNLNWFSSKSKNVKVNSIALFSFAPDDIVEKVIEEVNSCHCDNNNSFPIHAFVIDVLRTSVLTK